MVSLGSSVRGKGARNTDARDGGGEEEEEEEEEEGGRTAIFNLE